MLPRSLLLCRLYYCLPPAAATSTGYCHLHHTVNAVSVAPLWLILTGWCQVTRCSAISSGAIGKDVRGIRMKMNEECERKMTRGGDMMK